MRVIPFLLAAVAAAQTPHEILSIPIPAEAFSVALAKNGTLAAALCADHKVRVWSLPDKRLLHAIDVGEKHIDTLDVSRDGRWILLTDHKGGVSVRSAATAESHLELQMPPYAGSSAFSRSGKLLAIGAMGEPVQIYDLESRSKLVQLESPVGGTNAIAFSRDDAHLATVDGDTVVRIYDTKTGRAIARNEDFLSEALTVEFTADGKHAIAAGADKVVAFIDASTGKAARRMDRTLEPLVYLEASPDGASLAGAFMKADNMLEPAPVAIWETATGRKRGEWLPPSRPLTGGWMQDGKLVVATGTKDAIHLWQVR